MPLNPFASEWVPPKVQTSVPASKSKDIASRARHVPRTSAQGSNPLDLVALSPRDRPAAAPAAGDDELNFEDGFDHDSAPSTPSTSLVGPSALPSPAPSAEPSPARPAALLLQTEDSPPGEGVLDSEGYVSGSVTHAETRVSAAASTSGRRLGPADFELLKVVGQGAFGKVFQVRKRDTGEIFAMKVMRKDRIRERDHSSYVQAERNVLTGVTHPYIVTLRYSFQTPLKLYLVLDFINGGHLFFQLYRAGTFDESLARLYTAEIVSAIVYLHSLGVVHRDLKPENVLLDSAGHIRITDFGLAKGGMGDGEAERSNSFIGTMEYMAPEIIAGSGHGKAVDWWSVGILLYEMLCGIVPFRSKSRPALQKAILTAKPKIPGYLSSHATSLIKALLQRDPAKRLGYGPTGSTDVMAHPFFRPIDWKALERRAVPSPFRPNLSQVDSVENFDRMWTDMPAHDSPCPTPRDGSIVLDDDLFRGFSYVAPSLISGLSLTDAKNLSKPSEG